MDTLISTTDSIRHPVWCRRVPADAPLAGDPVNLARFYGRLAAPEPDAEHCGREYRLDAGPCFTYSVTVRAGQTYERSIDGEHIEHGAEVCLRVQDHEHVQGPAEVRLRVGEVARLIDMLQRARQELTCAG